MAGTTATRAAMSYRQRVEHLRRTKLEQTAEKQKVIGAMAHGDEIRLPLQRPIQTRGGDFESLVVDFLDCEHVRQLPADAFAVLHANACRRVDEHAQQAPLAHFNVDHFVAHRRSCPLDDRPHRFHSNAPRSVQESALPVQWRATKKNGLCQPIFLSTPVSRR